MAIQGAATSPQAGVYPRFDLEGQTALITGAARGIGRSIALALAHAGADVALGLRQSGTADDLLDEIASMGRRTTSVAMDVRRLDQIGPAVEAVTSSLGRLDILVNNAGLGPSAPAEEVTEENFDLTFGVNVNEFADDVMGKIQAGALEAAYGFAEQASRASRDELTTIFQRMNSQ